MSEFKPWKIIVFLLSGSLFTVISGNIKDFFFFKKGMFSSPLVC